MLHTLITVPPAKHSWLYTLFLMIDANFRLKLKDRGINDTFLGPGWAYIVEDSKFKEHLEEFAAADIEVNIPSDIRLNMLY